MRMAVAERLAVAVVISASAHFAVLAHVPLAPGLGDAALFPGHALTARIVSGPQAPQNPEPLPRQSEPEFKPAAAPPAAASVAQAAALPSAEIYFRGSELDERAMPLNTVTLAYPDAALAAGQSGVVTLRLRIDHQGVLREAEVVEAQPAGVFENSALQAVRELRFRPAMRNGVPVGSVKTIEVPFHPDCRQTESCVAAAGNAGATR